MKKTLIAITAALVLLGCKGQSAEPVTTQRPVSTAEVSPRSVDIKISGSEYQPASITVQRGETVRLNFTRDAKPTCGDVLVFPALKITKPIPVNQVTSIDIRPESSGDLEFTCGMNMMKGKVVVQ